MWLSYFLLGQPNTASGFPPPPPPSRKVHLLLYLRGKHFLNSRANNLQTKIGMCVCTHGHRFWLLRQNSTSRKFLKMNHITERIKQLKDRSMRQTNVFFILSHCFGDVYRDSYPEVFFNILNIRLRSENSGRIEETHHQYYHWPTKLRI